MADITAKPTAQPLEYWGPKLEKHILSFISLKNIFWSSLSKAATTSPVLKPVYSGPWLGPGYSTGTHQTAGESWTCPGSLLLAGCGGLAVCGSFLGEAADTWRLSVWQCGRGLPDRSPFNPVPPSPFNPVPPSQVRKAAGIRPPTTWESTREGKEEW